MGFTARSDGMKRKLAVSFSVIMTFTACTAGSSGTGDITFETLNEDSVLTETASEVFYEHEITLRSSEQTGRETAAVSFTESEEAGYKALYRQKLTEITESVGEYKSTFDLFDIDSDGIPELLAANGDYHVASVGIYTVKNGECIRLDNPAGGNEGFGSWGVVLVAEGGYIASQFGGMGSGYDDYFRLENGEITLIISAESHAFFDCESDEVREKFVIDGKEVTNEEYDEALALFEEMEWTAAGQGYSYSDMDKIL